MSRSLQYGTILRKETSSSMLYFLQQLNSEVSQGNVDMCAGDRHELQQRIGELQEATG